jgi:hypothetical protein
LAEFGLFPAKTRIFPGLTVTVELGEGHKTMTARNSCLWLFGCVAVFVNTCVRANEDKRVATVLERAHQAVGFAPGNNVVTAVEWREEGKLTGTPFTCHTYLEYPLRYRAVLELRSNEATSKSVIVTNENRGWTKNDNGVQPMDREELWRYRNQVDLLSTWTLALVKDKGVRLSLLGEEKVNGKAAVVIRVVRRGHRDRDLFFDKSTGLLLKARSQFKPFKESPEVVYEISYLEWQKQGTLKYPKSYSLTLDGFSLESKVRQLKLCKKLDRSLFSKP